MATCEMCGGELRDIDYTPCRCRDAWYEAEIARLTEENRALVERGRAERLRDAETVTVNRERWERVLADAREWSTQMRGKNWGPGAESQLGDLDPIEPDPQPSLRVETMLEALFELDGWVQVAKNPIERPVYSIGVFVDGLDGTDERFDADDWRSALRAAYVAVTREARD